MFFHAAPARRLQPRPSACNLINAGSVVRCKPAEQATAAATAHFDPGAASLVVVGDAAQFGAQLKRKYPKVEAIGIDKLNLDSATLR